MRKTEFRRLDVGMYFILIKTDEQYADDPRTRVYRKLSNSRMEIQAERIVIKDNRLVTIQLQRTFSGYEKVYELEFCINR